MPLKFPKQLRRFALACLISLSSTVAGLQLSNLHADETPRTAAAEFDSWTESNTCNFDSIKNEDYSYSIGTHDSFPIHSRTSCSFESSLAAIAATACASTGVSVEQMIEPFAMVGTQTNDIHTVFKLEQWLSQAKKDVFEAYDLLIEQEATATEADAVASEVSSHDDAEFDEVSLVPLVDFDSELDYGDSWVKPLASASTAEPIDVDKSSQVTEPDWDDRDDDSFSIVGTVGSESADEITTAVEALEPSDQEPLHTFGQSVLFESSQDDQPSAEPEAVAAAPFAGSAPVIVSIDEVYMPYDFAVRDLQVGRLFPLTKQPFCIRSRVELPELPSARSHVAPSIQDEIDELVLDEVQDADMKRANSDGNDELLEKALWHTQLVIEDASKLRDTLRPKEIGRQIAAFVVSSDTIVNEVATRLARVWPAKAPLPPSPAGAALLARAEAQAESVDPADDEAIDTEQIATRDLTKRR